MKKRKFLIHFTVVILVNAVAIVSWYIMFNKVRDLTAVIQDTREKIKQNEELVQNQRSTATLLNELEEGVHTINSAFVEKETIVPFVQKIEELARNTQNTIDIKFGSLDKKGEKPTFIFSISGASDNVHRFITALQYVPYKILITNVDMREDAGETWRGNINIALISYL